MTRVAIIGGTGLNRLAGLETVAEHAVDTPWGSPSHAVLEGRYAGSTVFFLARHGVPHHIPPHRINYRANLWALRELGVDAVLAVNAVGGIHADLFPGRIVIPDQIIDYTWGRAHSYFDDDSVPVQHIEFTLPYDPGLRERLQRAAQDCGADCMTRGTYGVTQGPRLETAAEIVRMRQDGCYVVGMTGMPEAALAAELNLPYAALCLVVNAAAGIGEEPITLEAMQAILDREMQVIGKLFSSFLRGSR